jgi:predicted amidophosphoribosyltransferase
MFCTQCGKEISDKSTFCSHCGTKHDINNLPNNIPPLAGSTEYHTSGQSQDTAKSNKEGDLRKCPSCGAPTKAFSTKCPDCGYEFRNIQVSKTIKELFEKLDAIEKERDTIKLAGLSSLISMSEQTKQYQLDEIIKRKKSSVIRDFPIPNSREEILELLHFIQPKIDSSTPDLNHSDWKTKFSEIVLRAKTAYRGDKNTLNDIDKFERSLKANGIFDWYRQLDKKKRARITVLPICLIIMISIILWFSSMSSSHDKGVVHEKERLEYLMKQVNEKISKKDYNAASVMASELKWEYTDDYSTNDTKELIKAWDEKRETIIETINNMEETKVNGTPK